MYYDFDLVLLDIRLKICIVGVLLTCPTVCRQCRVDSLASCPTATRLCHNADYVNMQLWENKSLLRMMETLTNTQGLLHAPGAGPREFENFVREERGTRNSSLTHSLYLRTCVCRAEACAPLCVVSSINFFGYRNCIWFCSSGGGMSTLELSSYVLEIPNYAYTTLSQNLIGWSTLSQEQCKLIGQCWKIIRRELW